MLVGTKTGISMNCFAHEGTAAVGVCGMCGKGVCRNCAVDLEFRLVCSENCGTLARNHQALQVGTERMWGIGGGKRKMSFTVVMFGLFGAINLCFGLYHLLFEQQVVWSALGFGIAFIVLALLWSHRGRSFWRTA
jgi:hypothetical protein